MSYHGKPSAHYLLLPVLFPACFANHPSAGHESRQRRHPEVREAVTEGQLLFELVGQVSNFTPTTSTQYGCFTLVRGVDQSLLQHPGERDLRTVHVLPRDDERRRRRQRHTQDHLPRGDHDAFAVQPFRAARRSRIPTRSGAAQAIQTSHSRHQVIVDTVTSCIHRGQLRDGHGDTALHARRTRRKAGPVRRRLLRVQARPPRLAEPRWIPPMVLRSAWRGRPAASSRAVAQFRSRAAGAQDGNPTRLIKAAKRREDQQIGFQRKSRSSQTSQWVRSSTPLSSQAKARSLSPSAA